jgi:hypothetical protein
LHFSHKLFRFKHLTKAHGAAAGGRPYWDWVAPGYANPEVDLPYKHWAMYTPLNARDPAASPSGLRECAAANASQRYQGAWGWTNQGCGLPLPYVCMAGQQAAHPNRQLPAQRRT